MVVFLGLRRNLNDQFGVQPVRAGDLQGAAQLGGALGDRRGTKIAGQAAFQRAGVVTHHKPDEVGVARQRDPDTARGRVLADVVQRLVDHVEHGTGHRAGGGHTGRAVDLDINAEQVGKTPHLAAHGGHQRVVAVVLAGAQAGDQLAQRGHFAVDQRGERVDLGPGRVVGCDAVCGATKCLGVGHVRGDICIAVVFDVWFL